MPGLNALAYYTLASFNAAESFIVKATAPFSNFSKITIYMPGLNALAYYTISSINAAESLKFVLLPHFQFLAKE